ncbi:hypothetical protein ABPG73_008723 [Tetrahymena malaccensis]
MIKQNYFDLQANESNRQTNASNEIKNETSVNNWQFQQEKQEKQKQERRQLNFLNKLWNILKEFCYKIFRARYPNVTEYKIYSIQDLATIEKSSKLQDLIVDYKHHKLLTRQLFRTFQFIQQQKNLRFLYFCLRGQITNKLLFEDLIELILNLNKIEKLKIDLTECKLRQLVYHSIRAYEKQKINLDQIENRKLQNLKILILKFRYSDLSSSIVFYLDQILHECPNLKNLQLDFSQNTLDSSFFEDIGFKCAELERLDHFKIDMSQTYFYSSFQLTDKLQPFFERIGRIKSLDINFSQNEFNDVKIEQICKGFQKLTNTERLKLNLGNNEFEFNFNQILQPIFYRNLTHIDLDISHILYSANSFSFFMKNINELCNLRVAIYRFEAIGIDEEVHQHFGCFIGKSFPTLYELNLQFKQNLVNYQCINRLLEEAKNASKLKKITLNLRENQIKTKEVESAFEGLQQLSNLEEIDINFEYSYLSQKEIETWEQKFKQSFKRQKINILISKI